MYKYNKEKFTIKCILAYIFTILSCSVILYLITSDFSLVINILFGGTIVFIVWAIKFSEKFTGSYVEIKDEEVMFKSFYISSEADDYLIKYSDIEEITASLSFFNKLTCIYVKSKNYDGSFELNANYENHLELYNNLCDAVKAKNPYAKIDERIYYCVNNRK